MNTHQEYAEKTTQTLKETSLYTTHNRKGNTMTTTPTAPIIYNRHGWTALKQAHEGHNLTIWVSDLDTGAEVHIDNHAEVFFEPGDYMTSISPNKNTPFTFEQLEEIALAALNTTRK